MSAIWGVIYRQEDDVLTAKKTMDESMQIFKIDRYDSVISGRAYLACGHQYFTNESIEDVSPIEDKERGIIFCGDCFLTNREELADSLSGNDANKKRLLLKKGDCELAYEAFVKFGETFVNRLLGSFSFAIYSLKNNVLLLYTDHVAQRFLSYYACDRYICFGSVFQPVVSLIGKGNIKLNEQWITTAYADCTADTIKVPEITVYEDVFCVPAAHYVRISTDSLKKEVFEYWNPVKNVKPLKLDSDDMYRNVFVSTFETNVNRMMRSRKGTGIYLSGGLDSSTVAAFLAGSLAKEGKPLFTYTSVPTDGYEYKNDRLTVENESEYIYAQKSMYPNITPRFIDAGDACAFEGQQGYNDLYMQPVKPILNMGLTDAMTTAAANDECSLVFSGQNGNATISYGRILTYFYRKMCAFRFRDAFREAKLFCRRFRTPKKLFVKVLLRTFVEEKIKPDYMGDSNFLRRDLQKKYSVKRLMKDIFFKRGTGSMDSVRQRKNFCYMPEVFQHMGFYDTYSSLIYGVLSLDPTLSKEVIELTMSMPIDCYVKNGKERRAVRDYMKGYVCDEVLDNFTARGAQVPDYAYRVNKKWDLMKADVLKLLEEGALRDYLDDDKLKDLSNVLKNSNGELDSGDIAKAAVICSLSCFLKNFK